MDTFIEQVAKVNCFGCWIRLHLEIKFISLSTWICILGLKPNYRRRDYNLWVVEIAFKKYPFVKARSRCMYSAFYCIIMHEPCIIQPVQMFGPDNLCWSIIWLLCVTDVYYVHYLILPMYFINELSQKKWDPCWILLPTHLWPLHPPPFHPGSERSTQDKSNELSFKKTGSLDAESIWVLPCKTCIFELNFHLSSNPAPSQPPWIESKTH